MSRVRTSLNTACWAHSSARLASSPGRALALKSASTIRAGIPAFKVCPPVHRIRVAAVADRHGARHRSHMNLYQAIVVGVVVVAVAWDLTTRRIPNLLTLGAAIAALLMHVYLGGWSELGRSLAGWGVGVACFLPFFAVGGMGAGDVKLLGTVGAWLGPVAAVWVALFTSIAGGVMGLAVAAYSGYLATMFENLWCLVMFWRIQGPRAVPELTLATHRGPRLAYAVPV